MFADTKIELQRLVNRLKEYCDRFKLKINIAKTNIIVGIMIIFL